MYHFPNNIVISQYSNISTIVLPITQYGSIIVVYSVYSKIITL